MRSREEDKGTPGREQSKEAREKKMTAAQVGPSYNSVQTSSLEFLVDSRICTHDGPGMC